MGLLPELFNAYVELEDGSHADCITEEDQPNGPTNPPPVRLGVSGEVPQGPTGQPDA